MMQEPVPLGQSHASENAAECHSDSSHLIRGTAPLIVLQRPVLLIGRHLECDVRINSPKVSRRHCCLAMAYDRVLIRDLGSRNGVRVNGRVVDESRLYQRRRAGDRADPVPDGGR